jgi:hypothetical protein
MKCICNGVMQRRVEYITWFNCNENIAHTYMRIVNDTSLLIYLLNFSLYFGGDVMRVVHC